MVLPGFKGLPLTVFLKRLGRALQEDAALDDAAQLAYYFLFAFFPLLFFLVTLTAYLPLSGALDAMLARARPLVPASTMRMIETQLRSLLNEPRPRLLGLSLAFALWTASRGLDGFRKSLNLAYRVTESRSFLRTQWLAFWTTLVTAAMVLLSFTLFLLGSRAGAWLANRVGIAPELALVGSWLRWPSTALVIMLVAALIFYWLPDVEQDFKFITPGSVTSALLWLVSTWGFTQYADHASSFNVTYGSLGGAVVLLTWLYLSALVFILGGEVNAVIEHASPEGKRPGGRGFGESAEPGEHIATPPGAAKRSAAAWHVRWRHVFRHEPDGPSNPKRG